MDFVPAAIQKIGPDGRAIHGDDTKMFAKFYKRKILCSLETDEKGEIVQKEVVFVRIQTPGDKTKVTDRPAILEWNGGQTPPDSERFPLMWKRFQDGEQQIAIGTPLTELDLAESELKRFEDYGIYTIEHLSNAPDGFISDMPPGTRGIRDAGIKYLAAKKERSQNTEALEQKNVELQAQMDALQKQLTELAASKPAAQEKPMPAAKPRQRRKPRTIKNKETSNANSN